MTTIFALSHTRHLLERPFGERSKTLANHSFLVQTKIIEDDDYEKIVSLPIFERPEEVSEVIAIELCDYSHYP